MMKYRCGWVGGLVVAALACVSAFGQAELDPKAVDALKAASDQLVAAKAFALTIDASMSVEAEGMSQRMTYGYVMDVERPNKVALRRVEGMRSPTLVSDGQETQAYVPALNKLFRQKAPASLGALDEDSDVWRMLGGQVFGGLNIPGLLVSENPYETLTDDILALRYEGEKEINGRICHGLLVEEKNVSWRVWITAGDQARIVRVEPDFTSQIERMRKSNMVTEDVSMRMTIDLNDWQLDPTFDAQTFAFTAPEGAQMAKGSMTEAFEAPPHPLEGKTAPLFEAPMLDGETFKLEDHKGEVVVLDFWATWCKPCQITMPILIEGTSAFKDRGVKFFGVNLRESGEKIRAFQRQRKLEFPVVLDKSGEIGTLYEVTGIPQTVIVDREGKVAAVHVGVLPDLAEKLAEELRMLTGDGQD